MIPQSRMSVHIPPLLDQLKKQYGQVSIVETGTIRNTNVRYATGDGWSTYWIAKWVKENNGTFVSIDIDPITAQNFMVRHDLQNSVKFYRGNSLLLLPQIVGPIHFVLLDSANDAKHILKEFKLVEGSATIIVIDDVIMDSPDVVKGHQVVPYAQARGHRVELKDRLAIIRL